jgi:hypothetical protein
MMSVETPLNSFPSSLGKKKAIIFNNKKERDESHGRSGTELDVGTPSSSHLCFLLPQHFSVSCLI